MVGDYFYFLSRPHIQPCHERGQSPAVFIPANERMALRAEADGFQSADCAIHG